MRVEKTCVNNLYTFALCEIPSWRVAHSLFFLHVTTELGALPFPGFGKGGRRGCIGVFALPRCPVLFELYPCQGEDEGKSKDGPGFCGHPPFPKSGKDGAPAFVVGLGRAKGLCLVL